MALPWYHCTMRTPVFPKGQARAETHFDLVLPEEVVAGCGWAEEEVAARVREALVMEL
jgi:hypothetical protein